MDYRKVAPGLISALEDYGSQGRPGLAAHARSLGLVSSLEGSGKPARSVVFFEVEEAADLDHLAAYGVQVNQRTGRMRTGILPLESLDVVSEESAIQRIVPARYLSLKMELARAACHVPDFRQATSLSGNGVVVGVVDTGIDPKHPAFQGRILRIWDQELPGPGVAEGGYGAELTGSMIDVSRDTNGHGTHVAGIAAGEHPQFGGVAPEADLVVVKTDLQDAHIADGVRYIFRVAGELGRPAVVNLSLGGHGDPHDGSDALSLIIDSESGPGRIVCCAAGNEGNDNIHAQKTVPQGSWRSMRFRVPANMAGDPITIARLNGWYAGSDEIEVSIQSPSGFQTPYQGIITDGTPARSYQLPDGNVRIFTPGPDPINGDHNFLIEIRNPLSPAFPIAANVWRLGLKGKSVVDGRVDVWVQDSSAALDVLFTGTSISDMMKIGSPGAANSAVTVASYTTRVEWLPSNGVRQRVGLGLNTISDFSSEGPLRNGTEKPDVAAPGAMIIAPRSADSLVNPFYITAPGYRVNAGTSMATPFVAGLVALLLERDGTLDPAGVKALLKPNSVIPGRAVGTFDPQWGFGLIDSLQL